MLFTSYKKILLLLAVTVGVAFLIGPIASAKGEIYSWLPRSSKSIIIGGGGWFSDGYIYNTFNQTSDIKPDSGYDKVFTNNPTDSPFENGGACFIALSVDSQKDTFKVMSNSVCKAGDDSLQGEYAITGTIRNLPADGQATIDDPGNQALIDGTYSALGPSLNQMKANYYGSLGSKAPCSSQGCDDTAWKKMMSECWSQARSDAASTSRLTQQAIAQGANKKPYNTDQGTKDNFSICFAKKINTDAAAIQRAIKDVSTKEVNAKTDAAILAAINKLDPQDEVLVDNESSCQIDGIGWLVCPVLTFLGTLADGMYNAIAGMLTVDNDLVSVNGKTSDTVSTTYSAWGTMRNIANVAFVIVFLIIIFSQLTNMVVSNYGVKKLLPRLIIAAILVNLSYTVCQLAVDISNILGWSLRDVFTALAPAADVTKTTGDASGNFGGWAAIVAIIIGGAGIAFAALSALIPILLAALIGLVVVFLILLLRKALIVILIIISPLAFVAFLLPNTEQWFKKWFKAFGSMLMVFPIVAVVFGASALAADIIKAAGDNNASGDANPWMQLIAMGVAAAPLMIVPGILKKSIDGVGNVGAAINKFGAKAGSGLGKLGAKGFENTALSRGRASRKQGRQIYRDQKFARAMTRGGIRAKAARGPSITGAQKFANQALTRSAYAASDKADQEAETAAEMMITKRAMLTDSERQTVAKGGSVTKNGVQIDGSDRAYRRAAIKIQASGKHDHIKELVDRGMTGEDAQLLAASIGASPNKPIWAGQGALQEIAQGTGKKTSELIESAVKADAYSSEKIATGDKDELAEVYATVTSSSSTLSSGERVKLRDNATAVDSNPELKAKVAKNRAEVSSLQTI